ncbi:MAG: antitoxin [Leptolyngbya sp. SIO1E4]|nr:antitoxin [Leptolyngbya sp. SIO1E4]
MPPLDAAEQALLDSVELGEWQSVPDVTTEIERYQHYAQVQENTLESVSLELPSQDLQALQAFAQQAGTSVSVLMATVLHQFITSRQE